jgi:hypothetical protein
MRDFTFKVNVVAVVRVRAADQSVARAVERCGQLRDHPPKR